ncbi:MAG: bifunctional (p)ppGpp synthetase/guanosine-3',5'-bis(diphosphate) 3'-pyrophosphohydrolase [Magnetococcales bacterium]|nr:bifunctional (p)ppGpp synthetase/guanosine-3',5'-bis(diphosphate) 3'-pyrophosphohydrolase [Magnetococcales bacterium]
MLEERISRLVSRTGAYLGPQAGEQVRRAADMALEFHHGQVRKLDGSPYVTHSLCVAEYCLDWGFHDATAICSALLHDAIEDAPAEMEPERRIADFCEDTAVMVRALSKIRNLQTGAGDLPATYRRILGAASRDLRVLIVKTLDQLHNSESLGVHGPAKAKVKASLGLIYVGIARRLGMMALADELIERLLPNLMPRQSRQAWNTLETLQKRGAASMDRLLQRREEILDGIPDIQLAVEPRAIGDFFNLAEKPGTGQLNRVGWPVHRLKLVVTDDDTAWRVLGRMHSFFGPMPRHIRDYLNAPRVNGFRALTSRVVWEGRPLNVLIVNQRDEIPNRMGVLGRWNSSGAIGGGPDPSTYMALLRTLGDSDLRMSEVHAHVLPDLLDVYTPRGDRLTFPVGAVVVDFAYLVHTDLGEHCTGARINGIQVPPEQPLADGDVVQVLTTRTARPQRSWLAVVKTARARTLIKHALSSSTLAVQGLEWRPNEPFRLTSLTGPDLVWSTCCMAVPGDAIVGRRSAEGGWMIHRADCEKTRGGQWDPGRWDLPEGGQDRLDVTFTVHHKSGALLPVLELMARHGINGHSIHGKGRNGQNFLLEIEMGGKDPYILGKVLKELSQTGSVADIRRYHWRS